MNTDQIKALKERADKASRLAELHSAVSATTKFTGLPSDLLPEALRLAKAGILARIERELEQLLATCAPRAAGVSPAFQPEPDGEIETYPPIPFWNMPDGSVSYQQAEPGNAS